MDTNFSAHVRIGGPAPLFRVKGLGFMTEGFMQSD